MVPINVTDINHFNAELDRVNLGDETVWVSGKVEPVGGEFRFGKYARDFPN